MQTLNKYLAQPLANLYGLEMPDGDIGLEFEVEGKNVNPWHDSIYWKTKADNSLRQGYEWVLRKPMSLEKVDKAIDYWFTQKQQHEMVTPFSMRTSIHVHINATKFTVKQIYNVITAYWLVEDLLCKFSGPTREGNLFCLRVRDADYAMTKLCEGILNGSLFYAVNSDEFKYGALNLQAILKYGSFEFRMMRGAYDDPVFIKEWVKALHTLCHKAKEYDSPKAVIKAYEKNPIEFLNNIFSVYFSLKLRKEHPQWKEMMDDHYHHAFTLATTPDSWEEVVSTNNLKEEVISNALKAGKAKAKKFTWSNMQVSFEPVADYQHSDEILDDLEPQEEEDF